MKYCGFSCESASALDEKGLNAERACRTFHVIYCRKLSREVLKNQLCPEGNYSKLREKDGVPETRPEVRED